MAHSQIKLPCKNAQNHCGSVADFYIGSVELQITSITRSPSHPNIFSSCTLHLDPPYAALENATITNHSSQITEILTDSQLAQRVITTSGPIHVNGPLQIMGDMFAAPIYGGNVGGQNNTNHCKSRFIEFDSILIIPIRQLQPHRTLKRWFPRL